MPLLKNIERTLHATIVTKLFAKTTIWFLWFYLFLEYLAMLITQQSSPISAYLQIKEDMQWFDIGTLWQFLLKYY